jgi:hypothetical protein
MVASYNEAGSVMRTAVITIKGVSPYSASKVLDDAKPGRGESHEDHEERTWRQRLNIDSAGVGIVPPMAFAKAIQKAAKDYCGKVKGEGNTTWTKYFEQGILVTDPLPLPVTRENVQCERLFVPSDGVRGSGKRVWKCFPIVHQWGGSVTVYVLSDKITPTVFEAAADVAFKLVGIGRFRPEHGGFYGRGTVESIAWTE